MAGSSQTGIKTYLVNAWILMPAVLYMVMISQYAVNIPYMDDYHAILDFLCNFKTADFSHKISLLFSQHNEHRILSSRIIYVIYYNIFGDIDFKSIIFLANLELLFIFFIAVYFIKRCLPKYWNIAAFILALGFFDINNYENGDFAMAGLQNYGVMLWFMASLFFYDMDKKWAIIPAILFQLLCIYSSGNGVLGALCIVIFNLFNRDKKKLIASLVVLLVFAPLYFVSYKFGETAHSGKKISLIVPYFLHTVGAHFSNDYGIAAALVMLALLAVFFPVQNKRIILATVPLICIVCFLLTTLGTIAVFRQDMVTEHISPYSSRYFVYSHFLVGIIIVFIMTRLQTHKFILPVGIALAAVMLVVYKSNYTYGENGLKRANFFLENADYFYTDRTEAKAIADKACEEGIYCIQDERLHPTIMPPGSRK